MSLARASASDYDPLGDDDEHHAQARAGRRPRSRHAVEHRELPRRPGGRQQGRRRHLPRRQAERRGRPDGDPERRARLEGRDLRRRRRPRAGEHRRRLDEARRRHRPQRPPALQARRRRQALPLLPRLDHRAAAEPAARGHRRARAVREEELRRARTAWPARSAPEALDARARAGGRTARRAGSRSPPTASGTRSCR